MRNLVIKRLIELMWFNKGSLEDEIGSVFTAKDLPALSNADLLALLEYTVGFQG